MSRTILTLTGSLLVCLSLPLIAGIGSRAERPADAPPRVAGKYIGASKCKNCHAAEETGDQYGAWSKAKHSHAFEVLASDEAKKFGAAAGVPEPQKDDECLQCHVTGFGQPEDALPKGWKQELGVQCETCHGPGGDHMKERFKVAASGAAPEGYQAVPESEVCATPGVDVCVQCHNPKSPSYKPFCYFEARAEIAHLNPKKERTEEELASYGTCPHGSPCPHAEGCPEGTCNLKPEKLQEMKQ